LEIILAILSDLPCFGDNFDFIFYLEHPPIKKVLVLWNTITSYEHYWIRYV